MSQKLYQLYCQYCNWKRITDGTDIDDLAEMKTSPIPGAAPKFNQETKKITVYKPTPQPRKFKCQKCGRAVIPQKIADPQDKIADQQDWEERLKKSYEKDWADGRKKRSEGW